jgi:hypothetical protein
MAKLPKPRLVIHHLGQTGDVSHVAAALAIYENFRVLVIYPEGANRADVAALQTYYLQAASKQSDRVKFLTVDTKFLKQKGDNSKANDLVQTLLPKPKQNAALNFDDFKNSLRPQDKDLIKSARAFSSVDGTDTAAAEDERKFFASQCSEKIMWIYQLTLGFT